MIYVRIQISLSIFEIFTKKIRKYKLTFNNSQQIPGTHLRKFQPSYFSSKFKSHFPVYIDKETERTVGLPGRGERGMEAKSICRFYIATYSIFNNVLHILVLLCMGSLLWYSLCREWASLARGFLYF